MEKTELVKAAKELNEVLGLDPKISLKAGLDVLKEKIAEAAQLIEPGDTITKETQKLITLLTQDEEQEDEEQEDEEQEDEEQEDEAPPSKPKAQKQGKQEKQASSNKNQETKSKKEATGLTDKVKPKTKKAAFDECLVKGGTIQQIASAMSTVSGTPEENYLLAKMYLYKQGFDVKKAVLEKGTIFKL